LLLILNSPAKYVSLNGKPKEGLIFSLIELRHLVRLLSPLESRLLGLGLPIQGVPGRTHKPTFLSSPVNLVLLYSIIQCISWISVLGSYVDCHAVEYLLDDMHFIIAFENYYYYYYYFIFGMNILLV
jgi:hypothetical protein